MRRKRGFAEIENSKVRTLLPVKQDDGRWIYPTEAILKELAEDLSHEEVSKVEVKPPTIVPSTFQEKFANERAKLANLKTKIALLCNSVTSDPEGSLTSLKELIVMLETPSTKMFIAEKKLLSISLLHVFTDILPTYKIRQTPEGDSKQKLKKETRNLLNYEASLLRYYKKYIDALNSMVSDMKSKSKKNGQTVTATKREAFQKIGVVATRCLCELLVSRHYFNYYKTLINIVVPLACNKNMVISGLCCKALEKVYRSDTLGEASLDAVKQTAKVVKERQFNVPTLLLRTFLCLKLQEANIDAKKPKADMKRIRKQMFMMSRKEKRYNKKMEDLEKQLRETEAEESKTNKSKLQTEILKKMFWIYFHVLKDDHKMLLITPVLEGLSKFAHLINLEFFDDLSSVLCSLMENETLSNTDKLHCMQTLFVILSGQAESLNIDPQRLYTHLYTLLLNLPNANNDQFDATLKCLNEMLVKRKKKITYNRVLAFMKRLTTITLQSPLHFSLAALSVVRSLMMNTKSGDLLLDTESNIGTGIFLPELEDPEYCNPASATLWELHILSKHYCPLLSSYAMHVLHGCPLQGHLQLSEKITLLPPEDILQKYSDVSEGSRIELQKYSKPPKRQRIDDTNHSAIANSISESDIFIPWKHATKVKFCDAMNEA